MTTREAFGPPKRWSKVELAKMFTAASKRTTSVNANPPTNLDCDVEDSISAKRTPGGQGNLIYLHTFVPYETSGTATIKRT